MGSWLLINFKCLFKRETTMGKKQIFGQLQENDVHPPVYYWMLHIVFLIFGNNVTVFRLFSVFINSNYGHYGIYPYS